MGLTRERRSGRGERPGAGREHDRVVTGAACSWPHRGRGPWLGRSTASGRSGAGPATGSAARPL